VALILEAVMTLVAAIMVEEIAQVAVVAEAVAEAAVVVVIVVVAEAVVVAAIVTVVVTAAVVAVTALTISKLVVARITKRSHAILTLALIEVIVQRGKKSHFKGAQRLAAEEIEVVESAIAELKNRLFKHLCIMTEVYSQ
jgi:hypothetical protein